MERYASKLVFDGYIVDEVNFKNNNNYDLERKAEIEFSIYKNVKKTEKTMEIELTTKVFENAIQNNYPFEMTVKMTGYFKIESNEENIDFEPNAIAILYPYIRAIVSTYTANANINSLILPAINVNKLIEEQGK